MSRHELFDTTAIPMDHLSNVVTASFETAVERPEDDEGEAFYNELLTDDINTFLHISVSAGLESIVDHVARSLPEMKSILIGRDNRKIGTLADRYEYLFQQVYKDIGPLVAVQKHKKTGQIRVKMPLIRVSSMELAPIWESGSTFSLKGEQISSRNAFEAACLKWAGGKPGSFIEFIPFNESLMEDMYSLAGDRSVNPFEEDIDKKFYDFVVENIKGFELRGAYQPGEEYNIKTGKMVPKTDEEAGYSTYNLGRMRDTPLLLYVVVEIPKSVASYITQSEDPDTRVVYEWFRDYYNGYLTGDTDAMPNPINTLDKVVVDTQSIREIKLTNDDDLCTLFNGETIFIPNITSLKAYNAYVTDLNRYKNDAGQAVEFDPYKTSITSGEGRNDFKNIGAKNAPIYTDWRLNLFSYLNTQGAVNTIDLNGARPADAGVVLKLLDTKNSDSTALAAFSDIPIIVRQLGREWTSFIQFEDMSFLLPDAVRKEYLKQIKDMEPEAANQAFYLAISRTGINSSWPRSLKELTPPSMVREVRIILYAASSRPELYGGDTSEFDYSSVADNASTVGDVIKWPGLQGIKRACDFIQANAGDYSALFKTIGVTRLAKSVPYYKALANTEDYLTVLKADQAARLPYRSPVLEPNYTPDPVPNIGADVFLLPHQVKADNFIKNDPENLIGAIQAGGGKTFLSLIDAARAMAKGERTAIIMPNYLLPNYLADGNYMFQGRVNFICVDNNVYGRYGEEDLRTMITGAPVNTITMFGLSVFSSGKNIVYSYNGTELVVNQIVEFFRSLGFDRVIIDESHLLANPDSNRSISAARALGGVKFKREMTGTFINGTVVDAVGQTRLLDPSTLGTDEEFNEQYADSYTGRKVIAWKPNAEKHIYQRIKGRHALVSIRRKEWAALLPDRDEKFHFVKLSKKQQAVYESILEAVLKEIEEHDPALLKKLREGNEEDATGVEEYLKRFLARVERFLASPDLDVLGKQMLTGADLKSPKAVEINKILADHFADPETMGGKVMIFTSYKDSAESIYENLDPEWKEMALHYTAAEKNKLIPQMKKNPKVKIVVGVENSLNTGHNFQQFTRLIRVETVWNPGTLDQAESRLNRPDPKNQSAARSKIAYDWVCCINTIDVTKTARLISKLLSATKFEEQNNPYYENLPNLPIVSMNYENIMQVNSFDDTLMDYLTGYTLYQQAQHLDYADYRKKTAHKKPIPLPSAGLLKGSAVIDVPYIPNMVLPYQEDLGLQNLGDVALDKKLSIDDLGSELKGKKVHTEFGDGVVVGYSRSAIRVQLKMGEKVSVNKLAAFLIPNGFSGTVRDAMNDRISLKTVTPKAPKRTTKVVPGKRHDEPEEEVETEKTPAKTEKAPKVNKPAASTDRTLNKELEVFLGSVNNSLAVFVDTEDPDANPKLMDKIGMTLAEPYYYVQLKTAKQLEQMIDSLQSKFKIPAQQIAAIEAISDAFSQGKQKIFNIDRADQSVLRNFVLEGRRAAKPGNLFVYPVIDTDMFFLCAWADQPAAKKLPSVTVPGARWKKDDGYYIRYFKTKAEAKTYISSFSDFGIKVSNLEDVKQSYQKIKLR